VYGFDASADELALHVVAAMFRERIEDTGFATGPGEERDFVDWTNEGCFRVVAEAGGCLAREPCEAGNECRREDVEVVGPPVVPEVPDDMHPRVAGGLEHLRRAREVVAPLRDFDDMPADAVTGGPDSMLLQEAVVADRQLIVARRAEQVEPAARQKAVRRTLEAAVNETLEQPVNHENPRER